jgi:P-type Mg2+ transporter
MNAVVQKQVEIEDEVRSLSNKELLTTLGTSLEGLSDEEANVRARSSKRPSHRKWVQDIVLFLSQFKSPLVWILLAAVVLSFSLGDNINSYIILVILSLSGLMGFWQERKAGDAVQQLRALVAVTAYVRRSGQPREIKFDQIVCGDIVELNAGDIIPGDGRLLQSNDLHVNEAALTGESFPTEKFASPQDSQKRNAQRLLFQGTNVVNGTGVMVVTNLGENTQLGKISGRVANNNGDSAFERGIRQFSYLLLQVTLAFSILILLLNLYLDKPVIDSALFAFSLAIGITPELLPVIVTICLSMGAKRMVKKNVVVKKLTAIQNLGNINIFCTDKTGTLTEGLVKVHSSVDVTGMHNDKVLRYGCWNAKFETGFTNPIDTALRAIPEETEGIEKIDEVPYDFIRKRLSVVVKTGENHLMITKGSVQSILEICDHVEIASQALKPIANYRGDILTRLEAFGNQGFRTLAVCYKDVTNDPVITKDDESGMIFLGFILLFDPPKLGIVESLEKLRKNGVRLKLITGDNVRVAAFLAKQIGLGTDDCLTGTDLRKMSDDALIKKAEFITVFAEMEPFQKERIVKVLQKAGHTVGFLGDGINDASAMRTADVGISVDTAVDVARETADIVLMEKNLDVLCDGIQEGRKTFGNTMKYIFITTSANFGNMFSVAVASVMLPFLPLLPKQILLINFLTDIPAMTLSSDSVDSEFLKAPKKWDNVLIRNFMIVFGLISAAFDILTFSMLRLVFHVDNAQFRTAWFVECILTELLIIIIIRSQLPVYKSKPSRILVMVNIMVVILAFVLIQSPFHALLGFAEISPVILSCILGIVLLYGLSSEFAKRMFFRKQKSLINY